MAVHTILFDLFASLAFATACGVIFSKNPIHSVIFLILVFCNATGLLLLFKVELIAMMFIIIYVGAIAVLFLFVVMMLNIKIVTDVKPVFGSLSHKVTSNNSTSAAHAQRRNIMVPVTLATVFVFTFLLWFVQAGPGFTKNWLALGPHFVGGSGGDGPSSEGNGIAVGGHLITIWTDNWPNQKTWISLIDSVTNIQSLGYLIYTYYFYYFLMASLILLVAMIGAIVLTMHKRKHASKQQVIFKQVSRKFEETISYAA